MWYCFLWEYFLGGAMIFITRNEILSILGLFVAVMLLKITGLGTQYRSILIMLPVILAVFLSKVRSNRVNIPVKGKNKKNIKQEENFLKDAFVNNKSLSYGATILWLSTLFVIVTEIMAASK